MSTQIQGGLRQTEVAFALIDDVVFVHHLGGGCHMAIAYRFHLFLKEKKIRKNWYQIPFSSLE